MSLRYPLLRRAVMVAGVIFAASAVGQSSAADMDAKRIQSIAVENLSPAEAVELFKTLPCPTMKEMNGEFSGEMTTFPTLFKRLYWTIASKNPFYLGIWQGKSFRQTGPGAGRGYNSVWRLFGGTVDMWPMLTSIGPSFFDGKPAFRLVYRAFDHHAGDIHMLDEVRRLPDGRYLGIGRIGDSVEERRMPMPFLLKQRIGDYRQDVGVTRVGFDMNAEFQLLEFPEAAYKAAPTAPTAAAK
jgi:hypothetical protein